MGGGTEFLKAHAKTKSLSLPSDQNVALSDPSSTGLHAVYFSP